MRFFCSALIIAVGLVASVLAQPPEKTPESKTTVGLPQEPVAPKERSDLEDAGTKGKVRTIRHEAESFSGSYANKGRRLTYIEEFNEDGNEVAVTYLRDGVIASNLYFGYIDGVRVTKSDGGSGGNGSGIAVWTTGVTDAKPRDKRYEFKHLYEYSGGKLIKETLISNDGSPWITYTHIYRNGETEDLVYDNRGKLNQKYLHTFDGQGNQNGFDVFDAFKDPKKITLRAKFKYGSFDTTGNWTQRTQFYVSDKDGVEVLTPFETVYRTITYYP